MDVDLRVSYKLHTALELKNVAHGQSPARLTCCVGILGKTPKEIFLDNTCRKNQERLKAKGSLMLSRGMRNSMQVRFSSSVQSSVEMEWGEFR